MKRIILSLALIASFSGASADTLTPPSLSTLEGDTALSCAAILCLPSPTKPSECVAPIRKLFSFWKVSDMRNFINLCPVQSSGKKIPKELADELGWSEDYQKEQDRKMDEFKEIILAMPHDCSADGFNSDLEKRGNQKAENEEWRVIPEFHRACTKFFNHEWVKRKAPKYRGNYKWYGSPNKVERGWVE